MNPWESVSTLDFFAIKKIYNYFKITHPIFVLISIEKNDKDRYGQDIQLIFLTAKTCQTLGCGAKN